MWKFSPDRLRDLRTMKGLSLEAFGKAIGKTNATVMNWEKSRGGPTGHDLATIANKFQVTPCSFFVKADE